MREDNDHTEKHFLDGTVAAKYNGRHFSCLYCEEWNSTKLHCVHFNALSPFLEEHIPRHDSICAVFKWSTGSWTCCILLLLK